MKVAIYARVSTKDKQEIETQLVKLREYAERREFEVYKEYSDIGESGAKESRPAFDELIKDAHKRYFKAILIYKLDRLSRSLKHLILTMETLNQKGVDLITLEQNIDTTTSGGKLQFNMIGSFAEFERDLISERVKDGMARAKKKGKRLGRPKVEVDVEKIYAMHDLGMSVRQIAAETDISKSTVHNLLSNYGKEKTND